MFRNDAGDKIVVARKNDYTTFFNPNIPDDKGDIIDFLLHRLNGGAVDPTAMQRGNMERLQQALERVAGYVPDPSAAAEQRKAAPTGYSVQPLTAALPFDAAQLLRVRGINPDMLRQPDLAAEMGLLHANNGHVNLFFRWRDGRGSPAGGQYKYLNTATGGTAKYFLPGTTRYNSAWCTSLENRNGLFVCEDPFDAISYRQLKPDWNFALLATGGAITPEQIAIIKGRARQANVPVALGNDNDIAGQISNLKIVDEAAKVISVNARQQTAAILFESKERSVTLAELKEIVAQRCGQSRGAYCLAVPDMKDWNEELKGVKAKATPSPALRAALSSCATAADPQERRQHSYCIHR